MVHEHHMYVLRGRNSVHPTVHPSIRVLLTSIACLVGLSSMSLIFHSDHARRSFDQLSFHQRWLIFIETTIASSTLHSGCNTCWFLKLFSIKRLLHLALLVHFWNWIRTWRTDMIMKAILVLCLFVALTAANPLMKRTLPSKYYCFYPLKYEMCLNLFDPITEVSFLYNFYSSFFLHSISFFSFRPSFIFHLSSVLVLPCYVFIFSFIALKYQMYFLNC